MRVGLITATPEHPLLSATAALLRARGHGVDHLPPTALPPADPADVYLLKARTPAAIALARTLELRGVTVLNSAAATEFCQDRTHMALRADQAHLPFAGTVALSALSRFDGHLDTPLVIKSRHSRRGDLVTRVRTPEELRALLPRWADEPVVIQDFVPGSGWDHKLWVVGDRVFAALRPSEFDSGAGRADIPRPDTHPWAELARGVGAVFDLEVYGVDVLEVNGAPLIIDINAFPGMRSVAGPPEALADLVESRSP
ncbi:ATP-grasp domain-containing protein [Nocardia sp. NPDC055321]